MTPAELERELLDRLDALGIACVYHAHPPVFTVEEAEQHWSGIEGCHCKNIFLRNKKGNRHYLVVMAHTKTLDIGSLARSLREDRLSFASAERLQKFLGLEAGSVSPFGLIHDAGGEVQVVVDSDLKRCDRISFHPNVNTATVTISFADFEKFLAVCRNRVIDLPL